MLTIYPYLLGSTWVFDDPRTGLKEEAFVLGMSEMITRIVEANKLPQASQGIALHFGQEAFDGADAELTWLRSDDSQVLPGKDGSASHIAGNWYEGIVVNQHMKGWLCPALGLYFHSAPQRICVKAEALPSGIDPVWEVDRNAPIVRRFVSVHRPEQEGP